jgi:hypothetical protein
MAILRFVFGKSTKSFSNYKRIITTLLPFTLYSHTLRKGGNRKRVKTHASVHASCGNLRIYRDPTIAAKHTHPHMLAVENFRSAEVLVLPQNIPIHKCYQWET